MLRCQGRISVGLYVTYTVLKKQLFYSNISAMYNIFSECWYDDVMVTILPYQIELHVCINTVVFLWKIQNGEIWFSIFVDEFRYGLF